MAADLGRAPAEPQARLSFDLAARMWRAIRPAAPFAAALVAVLAIADAMSMSPSTSGHAVDVAVVGGGGVGCWLAISLLSRSLPRPPRTALDGLRFGRVPEPDPVTDPDRIEWALIEANWGRPWIAAQLAEILRPIVRARLLERRHIDPEHDPDSARRVLGGDAWELLRRPDESASGADRAPVTEERLSHLIEVLEEL